MASKGVNKVIIVGNLGQDPETKFAASGSAIANISVATSEHWKDKNTGQAQERTEWHRVVFFNRLAEIAGEYLRKGSKVYIEGSLRTRKWQDQAGQDRYTTEIVANEMQMLDSRGEGSQAAQQAPANQNYGHAPAPQPQQAPQRHPQPNAAPQHAPPPHNQPQGAHQQMPPPPPMDSFDEDIPF